MSPRDREIAHGNLRTYARRAVEIFPALPGRGRRVNSAVGALLGGVTFRLPRSTGDLRTSSGLRRGEDVPGICFTVSSYRET